MLSEDICFGTKMSSSGSLITSNESHTYFGYELLTGVFSHIFRKVLILIQSKKIYIQTLRRNTSSFVLRLKISRPLHLVYNGNLLQAYAA
jgi:hypothetical protein